MNGKQFVIENLENVLKQREISLENLTGSIKNSEQEIAMAEADIITIKSQIEGLKDALHKLKGLDNLEKKNKIADPASQHWEKMALAVDKTVKDMDAKEKAEEEATK